MNRSIIFVLVLAGLAFGRRYYDPEVGMWISVDPMEQHFSSYTYGGNNPVNRIDPDGGADYGTQENYVNAATKVVGEPAYKPGGGVTYCNKGTMAIANTNLTSPLSGTANEITIMLTNKEFATPITPGQAVEYAKQGITTLAAWQDPAGGHGHVATVAPSTDDKGRPNVFNIGIRNALMSIAEAFGRTKRESSNFGYYILNEDLNSLKARTTAGQ